MADFLKSIDACVNGKLDKNTCKRIFLQTGMMAELDAINLYQMMAKATKDKKIRHTLLDIAREEKTHVGEFQYLLKKIDKEFTDELKKGEMEVKK